jgi:hypothetical protein
VTEILVPYSRFLECKARRAQLEADLPLTDPTPGVEVTKLPEATRIIVQSPTVIQHD